MHSPGRGLLSPSIPGWTEVRVAIGMDTAVRGFIATVDTGSDNGWLVNVLARAYTGGAWTSLSGGGGYDTKPFRERGIRVLELEDNYPFHQQHTPDDVPAIVNPGSVQQLGEQALSVVREMGDLDLSVTSGEQQTYAYVPLLGLAHYPQSWALPFAILAAVLMLVAVGLALWQRAASWRGLGLAALVTLLCAALAGLLTNAVWGAAPDLFDWPTRAWRDWPEVIPPHGWLILILTNLVNLALMVAAYRLVRRWSGRVDFSLVGLLLFGLFAPALALAAPQGAILVTWPALIGALCWIGAVMLHRQGKAWALDLARAGCSAPGDRVHPAAGARRVHGRRHQERGDHRGRLGAHPGGAAAGGGWGGGKRQAEEGVIAGSAAAEAAAQYMQALAGYASGFQRSTKRRWAAVRGSWIR